MTACGERVVKRWHFSKVLSSGRLNEQEVARLASGDHALRTRTDGQRRRSALAWSRWHRMNSLWTPGAQWEEVLA